MALVEKYHDANLADRVFELAWTHSQVVLQQLNVTEADAQLLRGWRGMFCMRTRCCARRRA